MVGQPVSQELLDAACPGVGQPWKGMYSGGVAHAQNADPDLDLDFGIREREGMRQEKPPGFRPAGWKGQLTF